MKAEFNQDEIGLGESGLYEVDALTLHLDGILVKVFDDYYYRHSFPEDMLWSPGRRRICFVADKYTYGTFPADSMDLDGCESPTLVLVVFDIYDREVVKEITLSGDPQQIRWDALEDLPVVVQESIKVEKPIVKHVPEPGSAEEKKEFEEALQYIRTPGTIKPSDRINDPNSLEYWLFYYDSRYVKETPYEYASRMRAKYHREHSEEAAPAPDPAPAPSPAPAPEAAPKKDDPEVARKRKNARVLILVAVATVFYIALAGLLLKNGSKNGASGMTAIPMFIIFGTIFWITRDYQPRIPGRYNLWRVLVGFVLLLSSATYQVAKLVNRLVGLVAGGTEYPGWTFLGASVLLVVLWIVGANRKNLCLDLELVDDAKRWGWLTPICVTLILGFFLYAAMTY